MEATPSATRGFVAPIVVAVAIGALSRMVSLTLLASFYLRIPITDVAAGPFWSRPFAIWDGSWYVGIASSGYHANPVAVGAAGPLYDIAFFPVWPMVIWAGSLGGTFPPAAVAGILANLLFIAACPLMFRALEPRVGPRTALWGVALTAMSPASFVFSLAYSESLFLVVASVAFITPQARWFALLAVTRLTGGLVAVGAAVDAWRRGDREDAALWLGIPVAAFGTWMFVLGLIVGRPDAYFLGSPAWYLSNGTASGPATLLENPVGLVVVAYLAVLVLGGIAVGRVAPGMAVYALAMIAIAVVLGRWESMPRLVLCAFPAMTGLALVFPKTRAFLILIFALLQTALIYVIVSGPFGP